MSRPITFPGGNEKGRTPEEASDRTLSWWSENAKNPALKKACVDEIKRRAAGGQRAEAPPPPPPTAEQTAAIQRAEETASLVLGSFDNAQAASAALARAAAAYHLITPATIIGRIPDGFEVAIQMLPIDPYGPEVYSITGSREKPDDEDTVGLGRVALEKILGLMGGEWESSRRTDDGSHPHYCAWEAWAVYPGFDLQKKRVPGNVDIDTREDGPVRGAAAEEIRIKAERRRVDYPKSKNDGGESQLLELRKFLIRHCESKAMNKAIGNCGVRRSYKRSELRKPFAVAQLMFTGHSDDPEARRDFRRMIGERFLGVTNALYGDPQSAPQALPAAQATPALQGPPPLAARPAYREAHGEPVSTPLPSRNAVDDDDQEGPPDDYMPAPKPADTNAELAEEARKAKAY